MPSVDLNADLGEGFGAYSMGDDAAMLRLVTSANVACGFHAGDPEIMARTFALARENGVAIGAHPGFPDLAGFGRRRLPFSAAEIERLVAYQVGAAAGVASHAGHRIAYVKAHGALANIACEERAVADAVARAVRAVDRRLALLAIALSEQVPAAEAAGVEAFSEVYADRGYDEHGQLIARGSSGALIDDLDFAAERAVVMATEGVIVTASGARLKTPVRSICVHGDSDHAVAMARTVRLKLEAAGVTLAPFAS